MRLFASADDVNGIKRFFNCEVSKAGLSTGIEPMPVRVLVKTGYLSLDESDGGIDPDEWCKFIPDSYARKILSNIDEFKNR